MTDALIHLRVPAVTKARWVRESRAAGMRLTDWIVERVERNVEIEMDATGLMGLFPAGPTNSQREQLRADGWKIAAGKISADGSGYYAAREGGGYEKTVTPCEGVVQVTRGCPASCAEVAFRA